MHYENLPFFALLNKKAQLRVTPGKKTKINNDETFYVFSIWIYVIINYIYFSVMKL